MEYRDNPNSGGGGNLRHDVGVVIVHYHRESELQVLLSALLSTGLFYEQNLVVVNNGSSEAIEDARRLSSLIRWADLDNPGYGAALNHGESLLPDAVEYLLFLTHEVALTGGCIQRLIGTLKQRSEVGLVGPMLVNSRSPDQVWSLGGGTTSIRRLPFNIGRGMRTEHIDSDPRPKSVDWLDGSVVAIRRADFLTIGGVSEAYFLYFEDVDLGWKIREVLGKIVVCDLSICASQSPGGALDQYLATRNLLWLLRSQQYRFARLCYIVESVLRLAVGPLFKPKGSMVRFRRRWKGLVDGLGRDLAAKKTLAIGPRP